MKIVKEARGARKLREHELSYFGVKINENSISNETHLKINNIYPKRTLPPRRLTYSKTTEKTSPTNSASKKWNLVNDKPDLLCHSPRVVEANQTAEKHQRYYRQDSLSSLEISDENEELRTDEPFYENVGNRIVIKAEKEYSRKNDTDRDEMILSEMTRNADQTLKVNFKEFFIILS